MIQRNKNFRTALVTGSSSGIGLAIARRMAEQGLRVLVLAHVAEDVREAVEALVQEGRDCHGVVADFARSEDRQGLWSVLEEKHGPIDILVNNAGVGYHATLLDSQDEKFRQLFELNFFAAVDLTRQALGAMGDRRRGQIVNVTSASARRGLASMSAYAASKGAMHIFSQTVRLEAARLGVGVSEVLPISVDTPFFANTGNRQYRPRGIVQTPERVAGCVLRAISYNRAEVCTHAPTAFGFALESLAPNWVAWLLQKLQSRESR